jgi:hypothetical protein
MEILDGSYGSRPLREVFGYQPGWEFPSPADTATLRAALNGDGKVGVPGVFAGVPRGT